VKWATRPGVHVDRTGCAWLIRRFIDAEAELSFMAAIEAVPNGTTPFDMRGAELSPVCSDEEMLELTGRLYDGFYEYKRRATVLGTEPS
jgi:hypothetical protein